MAREAQEPKRRSGGASFFSGQRHKSPGEKAPPSGPPKRSIPESYSFDIGLKRLGRQANTLEGQPAKRANGSKAGVSPLPKKRPTMRSLSFDLKARTLRMDSSSRDLASKGAGAPKHDEAVPSEDSDTRRSLPLRQEPGQGGDPLATAREGALPNDVQGQSRRIRRAGPGGHGTSSRPEAGESYLDPPSPVSFSANPERFSNPFLPRISQILVQLLDQRQQTGRSPSKKTPPDADTMASTPSAPVTLLGGQRGTVFMESASLADTSSASVPTRLPNTTPRNSPHSRLRRSPAAGPSGWQPGSGSSWLGDSPSTLSPRTRPAELSGCEPGSGVATTESSRAQNAAALFSQPVPRLVHGSRSPLSNATLAWHPMSRVPPPPSHVADSEPASTFSLTIPRPTHPPILSYPIPPHPATSCLNPPHSHPLIPSHLIPSQPNPSQSIASHLTSPHPPHPILSCSILP